MEKVSCYTLNLMEYRNGASLREGIMILHNSTTE